MFGELNETLSDITKVIRFWFTSNILIAVTLCNVPSPRYQRDWSWQSNTSFAPKIVSRAGL